MTDDRAGVSIVVGYGSDMGNAEDAAMSFAEAVEQATGMHAEAVELNQLELATLQPATHFVAVTSTFGEGEFPDNATLFWEALNAETATRLDQLKFAVLALGDSGYDLFCNAGRLLDERLAALGATRLLARVDVDGSYLESAATWTGELIPLIVAGLGNHDPVVIVTEPDGEPAESIDPSIRDRDRVFEAGVAVNRLLSAPESDKEVRHYELDLAGSEIHYSAGDSIAVHAGNDPVLVAEIVQQLRVAPDYRVADYPDSLGVLLAEHLEIRTPSRALKMLVGSRTKDAAVAAALSADMATRPGTWLYGKDVLDLIRLATVTPDELVGALRPLQSRDYSIASSPAVHPDRVHLTVATVRYSVAARRHGGVASTFLADRGDKVKVRLRPNHSFRLPAQDVPIIMIGPGTGLAPFRGFLQERQASAAAGPSWLFFGARRRATDFLYADELQGFCDTGALTRLDVAFSRDRCDTGIREYVQHRMAERSSEIFGWLQDGAHIYVCGNADRMAGDVDATLRGLVARHGGMSGDAADRYVNELIRTHRYLRDVY